jgi:DNA-binding transcriptional LysR family regulator
LGVTALSKRLVSEELARGTLKPLKVTGWPLRRTIRIVRLKEAFVSRAVQHFLQLLRKKVRHVRFLETVGAIEAASQVE